MKSFYEKLKDGKGKNIALALTQKEFRDHPKSMAAPKCMGSLSIKW